MRRIARSCWNENESIERHIERKSIVRSVNEIRKSKRIVAHQSRLTLSHRHTDKMTSITTIPPPKALMDFGRMAKLVKIMCLLTNGKELFEERMMAMIDKAIEKAEDEEVRSVYKKAKITLLCVLKLMKEKEAEKLGTMMTKRLYEDTPMVSLMIQMFCSISDPVSSLEGVQEGMERGELTEGSYLNLCNDLRDAYEVKNYIDTTKNWVLIDYP